jgi:hypothetical protein
MPQVRYLTKSSNHRRLLSLADLTRLKVDHPADIAFEESNNWTVEMNDEACKALVKLLPGEFVLLESPTAEHEVEDEGSGTPEVIDQVDASGEGASGESPDDSSIEASMDDDESPRQSRRRR